VNEGLESFLQCVEVVASGDSVAEGEQSGDLGECGRDVGVSGPSDDGVVPLNGNTGTVRGCFEVFVVFWVVGSPPNDVVA